MTPLNDKPDFLLQDIRALLEFCKTAAIVPQSKLPAMDVIKNALKEEDVDFAFYVVAREFLPRLLKELETLHRMRAETVRMNAESKRLREKLEIELGKARA